MTDNTDNQNSGSNTSSASKQEIKVYYKPTKEDPAYEQVTEASDRGASRPDSSRAESNRRIRDETLKREAEEKEAKRIADLLAKKQEERRKMQKEYQDEMDKKGIVNKTFQEYLKEKSEKRRKEADRKRRFNLFKEAASPKNIGAKIKKMGKTAFENLERDTEHPFLKSSPEKNARRKKQDLKEHPYKATALKAKNAVFGKAGKSNALNFINKDMKNIQKGIKTSRGGRATYRVESPDFRVNPPEVTAQRLGGFSVVGLPDSRPRQLPNQKTTTLKQLPTDFVNVDVFRNMKTGRMAPLEKLSAEVKGKNPIDRMVGKPKQLKGKKVKVPTISYRGIEKKINKKGGLF
jgi:hypothetical protein